MSRTPLLACFVALVCGISLAAQTPAPAPAAAVPASALAMMPKRAEGDTLRIVTHIGSFKIVPKGDEMPSGRLEFSFSGTVLISNLEPGSYLVTSGKVNKEYEDLKEGKQVYFGTGKMLIVGKFKNCQWFGRNLDLTFKGSAVLRIVAEFDNKLDTGQFWFDAAKKNPLQTSLYAIVVPEQNYGPAKPMSREEFEKKKKKVGG